MRDLARDFVRGLSVCEMEYANHSDALLHAPPSAGTLTFADTIMPMFTFISGMSSTSVYSSTRLVGLGVAYNILKGGGLRKSDKVRPFGVLQRLGLSQLLLTAAPSTTLLSGFSFPAGLCALWIALSVGLAKDPRNPFFPPSATAQTRIDKALCSIHPKLTMYRPEYDPEGLLGVLTTAISMWFGRWCVTNALSVEEALITGISLSSFGYMFAYAYKRTCPISKPFWTLSFTLGSSGISLLKYTLVKLAIPFIPTPLTHVVVCMGQRSLECFFASAVLDKLGFHTFVASQFARLGTITAQCISATLSTALLAAFSVITVGSGISMSSIC